MAGWRRGGIEWPMPQPGCGVLGWVFVPSGLGLKCPCLCSSAPLILLLIKPLVLCCSVTSAAFDPISQCLRFLGDLFLDYGLCAARKRGRRPMPPLWCKHCVGCERSNPMHSCDSCELAEGALQGKEPTGAPGGGLASWQQTRSRTSQPVFSMKSCVWQDSPPFGTGFPSLW